MTPRPVTAPAPARSHDASPSGHPAAAPAATIRARIRGRIQAVRYLARHGRPARVLLFGPLSLGDDLLCTTILREARRRGTPFAMMTARPELFAGNEDPTALLPVHPYYAALLRRLGSRVIQPYYVRASSANRDADLLPPHHIAVEMCRLAGLTGEISVRPYLSLQPDEIRAQDRFAGHVAVHSTGLSARLPFSTKEWGATRFAELVRRLQPRYRFVQLGAKEDPALPVDVDLRGATRLREAAAILHHCALFVGLEGFLGHLARAVDCPAVIVHGGRAPAGIFGYAANINLHATPDCSPCGLRVNCPRQMRCMDEIPVDRVAEAVETLEQHGRHTPLDCERVMLR